MKRSPGGHVPGDLFHCMHPPVQPTHLWLKQVTYEGCRPQLESVLDRHALLTYTVFQVMIMVKTRTLKETQAAYSLSLDKADLTQTTLIVEHEGEEVAALVPITEYRQFEAWRKRQVTSLAEPDDAFERERAAFERLKPQLLKTHRGKFVAVVDEQVVDLDTDRVRLALRVYDAFGYRPIYVQVVDEHLPRVRLPSVWIAR
jgi:hypothetical protein